LLFERVFSARQTSTNSLQRDRVPSIKSRYRLLKLFLFIPSLIIFPIVSYALDPILLGVAILSLVLAIQNVISGGRLNDKPSQA
jgi:hypothetical protein